MGVDFFVGSLEILIIFELFVEGILQVKVFLIMIIIILIVIIQFDFMVQKLCIIYIFVVSAKTQLVFILGLYLYNHVYL